MFSARTSSESCTQQVTDIITQHKHFIQTQLIADHLICKQTTPAPSASKDFNLYGSISIK